MAQWIEIVSYGNGYFYGPAFFKLSIRLLLRTKITLTKVEVIFLGVTQCWVTWCYLLMTKILTFFWRIFFEECFWRIFWWMFLMNFLTNFFDEFSLTNFFQVSDLAPFLRDLGQSEKLKPPYELNKKSLVKTQVVLAWKL